MVGYRYRGEDGNFLGFAATEVVVDSDPATPFLIKVTARSPYGGPFKPRNIVKFYYVTWVGFTLDWLETE